VPTFASAHADMARKITLADSKGQSTVSRSFLGDRQMERLPFELDPPLLCVIADSLKDYFVGMSALTLTGQWVQAT